MKKILIVGEPTHTMQVGLDTGVLLANEMLRRGFGVDYVDLGTFDWKIETSKYFASLPIQKLLKVIPNQPEPFVLERKTSSKIEDYKVIWQRLDPPVNERYIGHMKHFAKLPKTILQINNPDWTWKLSEHLLPQKFPEFAIPTWEVDSFEEFVDIVRKAGGEVVAKPLHLYSGLGIEFFNSNTPVELLGKYWEQWRPKVAVQPFISEITTQGDLRILVMNKKVVGSVLRKPKPGSRLANLHQGGSAHFFSPTSRQLQCCEKVAAELNPKGLYLLGLDFIGDYLTEVNITCPSAVPQINQVMGIQAEELIIDEMVKLTENLPRQ